MLRARSKGKTQVHAAARAEMSVRTARQYERLGRLPSQLKQPRVYRTRPNPCADDWPWVQAQLERDPALQVKPLFDALCQMYPGRYQANQLRTLQRHVATWRAHHGPARAVSCEQIHHPGVLGQSDFTPMDEVSITIAGAPFPQLRYHVVLTYSNVEAIQLCFSESFTLRVPGTGGRIRSLALAAGGRPSAASHR